MDWNPPVGYRQTNSEIFSFLYERYFGLMILMTGQDSPFEVFHLLILWFAGSSDSIHVSSEPLYGCKHSRCTMLAIQSILTSRNNILVGPESLGRSGRLKPLCICLVFGRGIIDKRFEVFSVVSATSAVRVSSFVFLPFFFAF